MTRTRSMLVSLVVLALVSGSAACQREDAPTNTKDGGAHSTAKPTTKAYEGVYLAPLLKEAGTPVACLSEFWPHAMQDECMNEPGVPFKAELPLTLAIWRDGTVIWRVPPSGKEPEYLEARLPQEAVSRLLGGIDLKRYMTPENARYSDKAISRYCPASVIMVSKGEDRLFLCSQLVTMESLQEYWVWEGSKQRTFPFSDYSIEEFCRQLPEAHSQHLKDFTRLRSQLRAMLPTKGDRITIRDRVLWTVVTARKNKEPGETGHVR